MTLILVVVLAGAGLFVFRQVSDVLTAQIQSRVSEDFALVTDAFEHGGERGMIEFIDWATATRHATAFAFGIFSDTGVHVGGTVSTRPPFDGWGDLVTEATTAAAADPFRAFVGKIGDYTVVVGRSLRVVRVTSDAVIQKLALAGLAIVCIGLITAFELSRRTSLRLRTMARTLDQVSRGNSAVRLPIGRRNDQIDFVSRQINGYLDLLAELMTTMRSTAIAIAHDLRTPLNRVSIVIQELEASDDPDVIRSALETAHKEIDGLGAVLDTILRISRIEASEDTSSFEVFELAPVLAEMVETFEPALEAKGQTLCLAGSSTAPPVFADRRMLQQMLVNLIENAGRYAGKGTTVELGLHDKEGAPVITVSDNGPGIPEDQRAAVLEPFFRIHPERNAQGTGLGLALVHAIATRHRAKITLSDNAPGLCVTVEFPRAATLQGIA
ncbi:MAG TPA: HAMP domain-containing sensor histidine kinase [Devosia sp.]|nr:HAMP domain-containing sensor histidine kinase [Devosia sp.]